MRDPVRSFVVASSLAALVATASASAHATGPAAVARVRSCAGLHTSDPPFEANFFDITARNISCRRVRRLLRRYGHKPPGWTCRFHTRPAVACTRGRAHYHYRFDAAGP